MRGRWPNPSAVIGCCAAIEATLRPTSTPFKKFCCEFHDWSRKFRKFTSWTSIRFSRSVREKAAESWMRESGFRLLQKEEPNSKNQIPMRHRLAVGRLDGEPSLDN